MPDAPTVCGISMTTPAITADTNYYRPENTVKDANNALKFPNGSATLPGVMVARGPLPASPENMGTGTMIDQMGVILFENTQGQGMPLPKTYNVGSSMATPPGDDVANLFDPVDMNAPQIEIFAFDATDTDPNSLWIGVQGQITLTLDSSSKFTGHFDNLELAHYSGNNPATDVQSCITMAGTFTWDGVPTKRTTFAGRDSLDERTEAIATRRFLPTQLRQ